MTTPNVERLHAMTSESDIIQQTGFPVDALRKLALSLSYETPFYTQNTPISLEPSMLNLTAERGVTFVTPENNMFTHIAPLWSENIERYNPIYAHFGIRMDQPPFRIGAHNPLTVTQGDRYIQFFLKETEIGKSIDGGGNDSLFKYTQPLRMLLMGLLIIDPSEFDYVADHGIAVQQIHRYNNKEYMDQSVALPAWLLQQHFRIQPEQLSKIASLREIAPHMLVPLDPRKLNYLDAQKRCFLEFSKVQKFANPLLVRCETPTVQ